MSKKQHIFQQSELSNDDFGKKLDTRGLRHRHSTKVNFRI